MCSGVWVYGLVADDSLRLATMQHAVDCGYYGARLRRLFVNLLIHCEVQDPMRMFVRYEEDMLPPSKGAYTQRDDLRQEASLAHIQASARQAVTKTPRHIF